MVLSSVWLVTLSNRLNALSIAAALLPVAVGLLRWRRLRPAERYLWVGALLANLLFGALCEVGRIVWHNNILILRTQVWLEAVLFGAAYYHAYTGPKRRLVPWLLAAFTLAAVVETVWFMDWRVKNGPYLHVGQSVLLIGLVLAYFEQLLSEAPYEPLTRQPMFLASVGVLLYYAGAALVYVLESLLLDDTNHIRMVFLLEFFLRIVALNGCLAVALWLSGRPAWQPQRVAE